MSCCIDTIFTATGVAKSNGGTRNTAVQSGPVNHESGNRSTATESDSPDGDTGSTATDEPDCGVYVHVNMYVYQMFSSCI